MYSHPPTHFQKSDTRGDLLFGVFRLVGLFMCTERNWHANFMYALHQKSNALKFYLKD